QSEGWTLTIIRTELGERVWSEAVAAGVVESRPGSEDPAAIALMDKLASHSRKRWPVHELPSEWSVPGALPTPDGNGRPVPATAPTGSHAPQSTHSSGWM